MLKTTTSPDELCSCPNCGGCLLVEEETEAWDDAVYEENAEKVRIVKCEGTECNMEVEVTLETDTEPPH